MLQNVTAAGLFTMMRGHSIFANPPLIVNESQARSVARLHYTHGGQLREGFKIIDDNLHVFDEAMEK